MLAAVLAMLLRVVKVLPKVLAVVAFSPVMPFIVAHRIRKEKPAMSKVIYALYAFLYVFVALLLVAYYTTP